LNLDILSLIQEEQLVGETGGTAPLPCLPYWEEDSVRVGSVSFFCKKWPLSGPICEFKSSFIIRQTVGGLC
jgi:hypothetical protein